jgi:hypothetical protein
MTLATARANASAKAKHIYNTGVNYDRHLRSLKYFNCTGHTDFDKQNSVNIIKMILFVTDKEAI